LTTAIWLSALFLGVLEGLTEFLPVSSTGHLILARLLIDFHDHGDVFTIVIQLGAILAVVALYFGKLWSVALRLPTDPSARRFVLSVLVAFLPAIIAGVGLHDIIKQVLFESPRLICVSLIVGGGALIALDRMQSTRHIDAMHLPLGKSLLIGLFQCLSLIPGVSRSGATISAGLFLGLDRALSARFGFLLAIPAVLASGLFSLPDAFHPVKEGMSATGAQLSVSVVIAFVIGLAAVAWLLRFLTHHAMYWFVGYRVVLALTVMALLGTGVVAAT